MKELAKYKRKRRLAKSGEPKALIKKSKSQELRFVVQEHAARHLHYDLRLEVGGVLKSWAVPKGPSLDPSEKRLAILVEDHPYDYQFFEGVIPEGYGAGTVKIWDKGTYSVKGESARDSERLMKAGLKKGEIVFALNGKKLRGEFALIRLKNQKNQWLLIKKKDQYTHLDKIYWPKDKITKGALIEYYTQIAPYILPHLKDRPESLYRFPEGINGVHFFQKNLINHPSSIKTIPIKHQNKVVNYLLIQNLESLLYAINLGCIELHPFFSRIKTIDQPDFVTFDLDPEAIPFSAVVQVAQEFHALLDELSIPHFCKTSGATGLHISVPLKAKYSYEDAQRFALLIAKLIHERLPKITSLERSPKKRQKKVYLDYLQNSKGKTLAAPYSVRARPGAPVSTPLLWSEVKKGLDPKKFSIFNVPARLKKLGDLYKPLLGKGISIEKVLKKLSKKEH